MSIAVNSILPVVAAQGVAGDVAFTPGSVVAARVVSVGPDSTVRIAIGNAAIDVASQVALQPGQILQLAVSRTSEGIRLAVIPQGAAALLESVTLAPAASANAAAPQIMPAAVEASVVSTAAQRAATQQASLSALFANLGAITTLQGLPMPLQQAVAQLLAQRPALDAKLTGDEVKSAFQKSGLFFEASLAQGAAPADELPDMKAALIVLRQALSTALGMAADAGPAPAGQGAGSGSVAPSLHHAAGAALLAPSLIPDEAAAEASIPAAPEAQPSLARPGAPAAEAALRNPAPHAASGALPDDLPAELKALVTAASLGLNDGAEAETSLSRMPAAPYGAESSAAPRSSVPPPPLRGALPAAQPMLPPTLTPHAPLGATLQHLLSDTDAALARQTLLQVASLPDRADAAVSPRLDHVAPRWNFEIPFAMPNGTAVAQFEIARDGGGAAADAAARVWRARFSLDVEPAGPVHALVSLHGDKTSVRMWAERPGTAQQLQAGSAQLNQALLRANLKPGDIVIREGAPTQPVPASVGHFLDRAL